MNLDIVMVNQETTPVICKALNYKDEVYAKFAKEIIAAEAASRKRERETAASH